MATAMGALLLVYGAWQILHWPAAHRTLVGDLFFYPEGLAAVAAAVCASRRCKEQRALRRCVALPRLGRSGVSGRRCRADRVRTGRAAALSVGRGRPLPVVLPADAPRAAVVARCGSARRARCGLAVVALGGALASSTSFWVRPLERVRARCSGISIAYPVGDMVLLVGLASVLLRSGAVGAAGTAVDRRRLLFFVARTSSTATSRCTRAIRAATRSTRFWMVAIALIAVAGRRSRRRAARADRAADASARAGAVPRGRRRLRVC